jgi:hypothetical protein
MSKQHFSSLNLARAGSAKPAGPSHEAPVALEPRKEVALEASHQGKKRTWLAPGMEEPHKANYEITKRLAKKIETLKGWDKIDTIKDFVNTTLEKEADRLIAQAEKEGY